MYSLAKHINLSVLNIISIILYYYNIYTIYTYSINYTIMYYTILIVLTINARRTKSKTNSSNRSPLGLTDLLILSRLNLPNLILLQAILTNQLQIGLCSYPSPVVPFPFFSLPLLNLNKTDGKFSKRE